MSNNSFIRTLLRDVTQKECPWLPRDFKQGEIIYQYPAYTYGCVSPNGFAATINFDELPFYEFPNDSVDHDCTY